MQQQQQKKSNKREKTRVGSGRQVNRNRTNPPKILHTNNIAEKPRTGKSLASIHDTMTRGRMVFRPCNLFTCESHKPDNRRLFWCTKMVGDFASWICYMMFVLPRFCICIHVRYFHLLHAHQCCSGKLTHPFHITLKSISMFRVLSTQYETQTQKLRQIFYFSRYK